MEIITDVSEQEKYLDKVEVLERIGTLAMLPGIGYATTRQVAEFFGVEPKDINPYLSVNSNWKSELESDGVIKAKAKEILEYGLTPYAKIENKQGHRLVDGIRISNGENTIWTRRSVLRLGMILQNPVAKQIRNYLLNLEEIATPEQKVEAIVQTGIQGSVDVETSIKMMNQIAMAQSQLASKMTADLILTQFNESVQEIKGVIGGLENKIDNQTEAHDAQITEMKEMLDDALEHSGLNAKQTHNLTNHLKWKLTQLTGKNITSDTWEFKVSKFELFKSYSVKKWESIPTRLYRAVWADIDTIDNVNNPEFVGRTKW